MSAPYPPAGQPSAGGINYPGAGPPGAGSAPGAVGSPGLAGAPGMSVPGQGAPAVPTAQPTEYKPASTEGLSDFSGYGHVGFDGNTVIAAPEAPPYEPPADLPPIQFNQAAHITDEEAREALLNYVAQNCCYGAGAAREMNLHSISPSNALHYKLETFCESRSTQRVEVPHNGSVVDGPFNGPPPLPWDIPYTPNAYFTDATVNLAVPHTDEVRTCGLCRGSGQMRCPECNATGRSRCHHCHGEGHRRVFRDGEHHHEHCHHCHGHGHSTCHRCNGRCAVTCSHCSGSGQVKGFIQLTIIFKNNVSDYIMEDTDMPDHLVKEVSGNTIFEQTQPQVYPVVGFPVQIINQQSQSLIQKHRTAFMQTRQILQRHTIRAVPVTEIGYKFKEKNRRFWVYGNERKVHITDYPHSCCCCTIL